MTNLQNFSVDRREGQSRVSPRLTEVHTHRIVLGTSHTKTPLKTIQRNSKQTTLFTGRFAGLWPLTTFRRDDCCDILAPNSPRSLRNYRRWKRQLFYSSRELPRSAVTLRTIVPRIVCVSTTRVVSQTVPFGQSDTIIATLRRYWVGKSFRRYDLGPELSVT